MTLEALLKSSIE